MDFTTAPEAVQAIRRLSDARLRQGQLMTFDLPLSRPPGSGCFCLCKKRRALSSCQGAGVMSVYLFMKRYAEEELYRPHPSLYRPRLSNCSDYSGQFLHPDSWPPPQRGRSPSEASSDISIQLTQTPQQPPPKGGSSCQETPSSSGPSSAASYQLQPASSSSTSSSYPHSFHLAATSTLPRAAHPHPHLSGPPPQSLPMVAPPSAKPPPHYHAHMRMSASPC